MVYVQEKAAYKEWFKDVERSKCAMFDEVTRQRGTWDDLCMELQVRVFARRGDARRVRSIRMLTKAWGPMKSGSARGHNQRTAKGRYELR